MKYPKVEIAVPFERWKDSLLYFDFVVPFHFPIYARSALGEGLSLQEILSILPQVLWRTPSNEAKNPFAFVDDSLRSFVSSYMCTLPNFYFEADLIEPDEQGRRISQNLPKVMDDFFDFLHRHQLDNGEFFQPPLDDSIETVTPSVVLSNIQLIDTSQISIRHISALRKDASSMKKLRRLRKFVYENYEGKSLAYIEDDLSQRLEDYRTTAKQWGLQTTNAAWTSIFGSSGLKSGIATTLALVLFKLPLAALLSAGTTTVFELGEMVIKLRGRSEELRSLQNNDHITYLVSLQDASK